MKCAHFYAEEYFENWTRVLGYTVKIIDRKHFHYGYKNWKNEENTEKIEFE